MSVVVCLIDESDSNVQFIFELLGHVKLGERLSGHQCACACLWLCPWWYRFYSTIHICMFNWLYLFLGQVKCGECLSGWQRPWVLYLVVSLLKPIQQYNMLYILFICTFRSGEVWRIFVWVAASVGVVCVCVLVESCFYGRLTVPPINFFLINVYKNLG